MGEMGTALLILTILGSVPRVILTDLASCLAAQSESMQWRQAFEERQQLPLPETEVTIRAEQELRTYLATRAAVKIECHPV